MEVTSENPVLNPEAAQRLQFTEIIPEVQTPEIPPVEQEVSSEVADDTIDPRTIDPRTIRRPRTERRAIEAPRGRHRRPEVEPPEEKEDKQPGPPPPPKTKPPDFAEWHQFTSGIVMKWLCRGYIAYVFRGTDRDTILDSRELKALEPDLEMLHAASMPFAHIANRNKYLKKNGRAIIDSATGIESVIALGMWANTVNRIAKRHSVKDIRQTTRKEKPNVIKLRPDNAGESSGQDVPTAPQPNVRVAGGFSGGFGNRVPGVGG